MVEFVEQARVHSWELLHGQVNLLEAFPVPVQQQPRGPAGDGRGVGGRGQLGEVHPLAPQALVRAQRDGEGTGLQTADDVHVRLPESPGVAVLLPDAQEGPEFRLYASFFKNFSNCCVSCVNKRCTNQTITFSEGVTLSKGFSVGVTLSKGSEAKLQENEVFNINSDTLEYQSIFLPLYT